MMLHGWMDVGASFQFVVDALAATAHRGARLARFRLSETQPATDTYWFPDYLADLDALLDALPPARRRSICSATAWAATSRCCMPAFGRSGCGG